jgi:hypothetical protein
MAFTLLTLLIAIALFVGILGFQEVGWRLGRRQLVRDSDGAKKNLGTLEGAVFGLMGLLMAFTFSGAAARFDGRRQLVAQEANTIGTAYLRMDLLPAAVQPALKEDLRRYLDARLAFFQNPLDSEASRAGLVRSIQLQNAIWAEAAAACKAEVPASTTVLVLPALNDMIDITTTRAMAMNQHPPNIIYILLGVLTLTSALLAGYGMAEGKVRSWAHILGFATLFSITMFLILDLEYPRLGLIRVDAADQILVTLRASMK